MKGDEDERMQNVTEEGVDTLVSGEGAVAAIVTEDENSPHKEAGEKPEEWEVGQVVGGAVSEVGAIVEGEDEEKVAEDVEDGDGEVGCEAMRGDDAFDLGEGGDATIGGEGLFGTVDVTVEIHCMQFGM